MHRVTVKMPRHSLDISPQSGSLWSGSGRLRGGGIANVRITHFDVAALVASLRRPGRRDDFSQNDAA